MATSSDSSPQATGDEQSPQNVFAFKTINLETSFDGTSTLVSNVTSDEEPKKESPDSMGSPCFPDVAYKRKTILWLVATGLLLLGVGFGIGWALGERKTALQLSFSQSNQERTRPSELPSRSRISKPSINPKKDDPPTASPTESLSANPTEAPTEAPTVSLSTSPTLQPTLSPTFKPTRWPTPWPTKFPTMPPTNPPTMPPTKPPTIPPTKPPTNPPTMPPTKPPTRQPTRAPTSPPTAKEVTYNPGNLTRLQNGLLLSEGLKSRVIAQTGRRVALNDGTVSGVSFHTLPDAGATFPDTRSWNEGGWIYVSNSEAKNATDGGVGAITFDKNGLVLDYKMVLENTHMNCGGGRTPWNTWVSCEEVEFYGQIYQVDPTGNRPSEVLTLGREGGRWESFAYDIRNRNRPRFFATEDHHKGCTRRFTPNVTHWGGDEWKMLHEEGTVDYLYVYPNDELTGGTFEWVKDARVAKQNARTYYPQSEGIDIQDGIMYIVCKKIQQLFVFDLDAKTFHNVSTVSGLFDGDPDQMQRILGKESSLLYFTEEGGRDAGIHARDQLGRFFTILESPKYIDETTGLSFSPDGRHLYVAYQENGLLFDVTREDGYPFSAKSLDVKYHNVKTSRRRLNSQWIGH